MDKNNLEETQPSPINSEDQRESPELNETQAVPAHPKQPEEPTEGHTVPTPTPGSDNQEARFAETIPPPPAPEASAIDQGPTPSSIDPALSLAATQATSLPAKQGGGSMRWLALGGIILILLAAVASAFTGYQSGINQRMGAEATQASLVIEEQFQLALQDMEAKRYDLARQRFEYVIQLNPSYPGVTEKLAAVLLELNTTATPTPAPTPTVTPTPDTRTIEELFSQAQVDLSNNDWSAAIDTLLALRKADPNYQPVWVDDMLYVSYRNRGKDKILKQGDLEGGIYDLTQAEQLGPLDVDAQSYLNWSRLYITGASFWELDWGQAVYYFAQVAPALPNLRDGSGWTATERYRLSLIGYGGYLADQKDWCNAVEQYDLALSLGTDPQVEETRDFAAEKCSGPSRKKQEQPSQEATPETTATTPTPPAGAENTPTPSPEPTQAPPTEAPTTEAPPAEPSPTPAQ